MRCRASARGGVGDANVLMVDVTDVCKDLGSGGTNCVRVCAAVPTSLCVVVDECDLLIPTCAGVFIPVDVRVDMHSMDMCQ